MAEHGRQANVLNHGVLAGVLEEIGSGFRFRYDDSYLARPDATSISLTMPLRPEPYESETFFAFFFGLLAEGNTRRLQEQLHRVDENDDFGLLLATGSDAIGSVVVEPM